MTKPSTVEEYLATASPAGRAWIEGLRAAVVRLVPEATEHFSYGMPGFRYRGKRLLHYAAWATHGALYGTSAGSTVKFPLDQQPPEGVLRQVLEDRKAEIEAGDMARRG